MPLARLSAWSTAVVVLGCSTSVDLAGERQKTQSSGGEDAGEMVATGGAPSGGAATGGVVSAGDSGNGGGPLGGCVIDCGNVRCGDGTCSQGETSQSCPADCGPGAGCNVGPAPNDLYIMFDQSQSMSTVVANSNPPTTWWHESQAAVVSFVQSPTAIGIGVGIQFFPFGGSIEGPDPNVPASSCYVPNYVTPEVEIAALPGNASAIVQAIQNHSPTTFTPTVAALRGAVEHMKDWGAAHPGRQPAVVLVTDGYPTECDPQDPAMIADVAREAYDNDPSILTFVVGLEFAMSLDNMNGIAQAGGTGHVRLIRSGGELASELLGIATTAPSCSR